MGGRRHVDDDEQWLNTTELSQLFRVHRDTVLRWVQTGRLPPPELVGRGYRWKEQVIAALLVPVEDAERQDVDG